MLPADDSVEGFDNIADVLGTSPALIERYIGAASKISRLAIGDTDHGAGLDTYKVRGDLSQDRHIEGLPLGTRGGIDHPPQLPGRRRVPVQVLAVEGELRSAVRRCREGRADRDERQRRASAASRPAVDDLLLHPRRGPARGWRRWRRRQEGQAVAARPEAARRGDLLEIRLPVKAGPQTIGVTFIKKSAAYVDDLVQRFDSTTGDLQTGVQFGYTTVPHLSGVEILGPYNITGPGDTPSRARIFVCRPANAARGSRPCARRILSTLARRALRRPVTDADMAPLHGVLRRGAQGGQLRSRHRDGAAPAAGGSRVRVPVRARSGQHRRRRRVSDQRPRAGLAAVVLPLEQHSRRRAAERRGEAARCGIRRCSSGRSGGCSTDPRSQALVTNFAGQWLFLRELRNRNPDLLVFPDFDDNLRQAFQRETELLFASIVREDRSVFDLMNADYTFVNERLARHYGIPERLRQRLPARGGAERGASGPARAGQHPDGDLGAEPHVAGHARRLDSREPARQPSAAAAARRAGVSRSEERPGHRRRSRPRCATGWSSIAPTRRAGAAIRSWIRSVWRSKTSTASAAGARAIPGSRSTRRAARRRHAGRRPGDVCARRC